MEAKRLEDFFPEEQEEIRAILARIRAARFAIIEKIGAYECGKSLDARGDIPCPNCEGGVLYYLRSGYNGHIGAQCTTPKCTHWQDTKAHNNQPAPADGGKEE